MMPRSQRLTLWCLALILSLTLYFKGRVPTHRGGDAAFPSFTGQGVTVRLAGNFPHPGVYRFPTGATAVTAIKMTLPAGDLPETVGGPVTRELTGGDVVTLAPAGAASQVISITKMGVKERMLLGIPLHPDLLGEEEWSLLPGIGPTLSRRIVEDRQGNGAFGSLEGLLRVPGIGPVKLAEIRRYF